MLRRMLCLLCAFLLLLYSVPALSASADVNHSNDFDLSFYLNAGSFPELLRPRASGYASLINRLGIRGNISWNDKWQSFDLDAMLYYTDDPSLSYPLHIYGVNSRVFITSPMINNEVILLNMSALMEFSIKAKNTLGIPISYFALLIPYTTEYALSGLISSWQKTIGAAKKTGKKSIKKFRKLYSLWSDELMNDNYLRIWISGVAGGSDAPEAVELEINSLPDYLEKVTGGKSLNVTVDPGSEIWQNTAGDTLFSRQESDDAASVMLSLPESSNGYKPYYSSVYRYEDQSFSMDINASLCRETDASGTDPARDSENSGDSIPDEYAYDTYGSSSEYDEYYSEDEFEGYEDSDTPASIFPEKLLDFHLNGSGLPRELPADSAFKLSVSVMGALYPDYTFCLTGETKKDGAVTLSLSKPFNADTEPVEILRCTGNFLPAAEAKEVTDYLQENMDGCYNVFSFNEQKLNAFTEKVLPPLIRSIFSFVAAAPTSACQSFLDDLTDIGVLDMLLE